MPLGLLVLIAVLVLMWMLLVRPQRRRQLEQKDMLSTLEVDDEVLTAGGMYGYVTAIEEDEVRLEIADGVVVRVSKRAIAAVVTEEVEEVVDEGAPAEAPAAELPPAETAPDEAAGADDADRASSATNRR